MKYGVRKKAVIEQMAALEKEIIASAGGLAAILGQGALDSLLQTGWVDLEFDEEKELGLFVINCVFDWMAVEHPASPPTLFLNAAITRGYLTLEEGMKLDHRKGFFETGIYTFKQSHTRTWSGYTVHVDAGDQLQVREE